MNATQREQVRLSILRYLDAQASAAPGRGVPVAVLRQYLLSEGTRLEAAAVQAELEYLRGKGLVETQRKALSPEVAAWMITSAGRDEYAVLSGE